MGGVESRGCAGHDLGGDALERRYQLAQDGAHAEEDHGHAELQPLGQRLHEVVAYAGGAVGEGVEGLGPPGSGEEHRGEHQVHQRHGERGGDHGVAQEA